MNATQATDVDAQIADLWTADNGTAVEIETRSRAVTGAVADTDVERLADDVVRRIVTVETDDDGDDVTLTVDDDGNGPFAPTATLGDSLVRVRVLDEQDDEDDELEQDPDAALDALAAGEWDVETVATAFEITPQVASNLVENGRHAGDILKWADNLDGALGDFPGVGGDSARAISAKIPLLEKRGVTKYGPSRDAVEEQADETADTTAETEPTDESDQGDGDEHEATLGAVSVDERAETLEDLGLSGREAEVTAYKEQGRTHAEIADELDSSKSTVDEYSRRAGKKLEKARKLAESVDVF